MKINYHANISEVLHIFSISNILSDSDRWGGLQLTNIFEGVEVSYNEFLVSEIHLVYI